MRHTITMVSMVVFGAAVVGSLVATGHALDTSPDQQQRIVSGSATPNSTELSIRAQASGIDFPWQKLVISGPTVVNLMAELAVIASQRDVDLSMSVPEGGFKYIQSPKSFRATIVQISNEGWKAFEKAHVNMYKVQLNMNSVPSQLSTANKILTKGSRKAIKQLLPLTMNQIGNLAKSSAELASEVYTKFYDVMMLLGEVAVSTTTARGEYEKQLEESKKQLKLAEEEKKSREEFGKLIRQRYDETAKLVDRYRDAYQTAIRKIPSGFKAIGMQLLRDIGKLIPVVLQTATFGLINVATHSASSVSTSGDQTTGSVAGTDHSFISGCMAKAYEMLKDTVKIVSDKGADAENNLKEHSVYYEGLRGTISTLSDSPKRDEAIGLLGKIGKLTEDAGSHIRNSTSTNGTLAELQRTSDKLKPFTAANALEQGQTSEAPTQHTQTDLDKFSNDPERYKAYLQLQLLESAERQYDKSFEKLEKFQNEMTEFMVKMAAFDWEKIRFEEIVNLLREGIRILGQLRTAWSQFTQFFEVVSAKADHLATTTLQTLQGQTNATVDLVIGSDEPAGERDFYLELFTDSIIQFGDECLILATVSTTYVGISDQFMVHKIAGLASLLAIDNNQERMKKLKELEAETNTSKDEINKLIDQRKKEFQQKLRKDKESLQEYLSRVGGPNKSDVEALKEGQKLISQQ